MDRLTASETIIIALRPREAGGRNFAPADRYPWQKLGVTPRRLHQLADMRFVGELTRESYQHAIAQREPGTVGSGFTVAELVERGIIDGEPRAAAPASVQIANPPSLPEGAEAEGEYWIVPFGAGVPRYEVWNAAGDCVSGVKRINGKQKAHDFAKGLKADKEKASTGAGKSVADEVEKDGESDEDDDDLQSGSGDGSGQDSPADR